MSIINIFLMLLNLIEANQINEQFECNGRNLCVPASISIYVTL